MTNPHFRREMGFKMISLIIWIKIYRKLKAEEIDYRCMKAKFNFNVPILDSLEIHQLTPQRGKSVTSRQYIISIH